MNARRTEPLLMERMVRSGSAWLNVEGLGNPADPCIILVMGAQASLLWWPNAFCEELANRGFFVLRYDQRDTGLSTKYPVGKPSYTADDLAADVVAILDNFGIQKARLLGVSSGGMTAQIAGLKYPDRFSSLAILSATPLKAPAEKLPGPTPECTQLAEHAGDVNWNDRQQVIDYMLQFGRVLAATEADFDEADARSLVATDFDRSAGLSHSTNHFKVKGGERWAKHLPEMKPPTTVLHGMHDPIFPIEHGRALAKVMPHARLIQLPGGHGLGPSAWTPVLDAITAQR